MNDKQPIKKINETNKTLIFDKQKIKTVIEIIDTIWDSVREPLLVLDSNLKILNANASFYHTFKITPAQTQGVLLYDLSDRQWNIPKLRVLLEDILPQNTVFNDFEIEQSFKDIGMKIMRLNARRIYTAKNKTQLILLAIEDVTENEYSKRHLEELVKERTAELTNAKQLADQCRRDAEESLCQVQKLKDQLEAERAYLIEEIKLEFNHDNIIGHSDELNNVLFKIEQIARTDTTVLILGETGTGKELVARAIHNLSLRNERAFVKINCATLPATLIESELFGHEKGAFTGAHSRRLGRFDVANNATLFMDEIGELPLELQSKMLRVIQDGEFERLGSSQTTKVNVRIIAATNRNLEVEVSQGRFRQDLWYRLSIFPIEVPPLRKRIDDIPLLVNFFVQKISKRLGKNIAVIPTNVMSALKNYHWPGNIRELENVIERAVINSSGPKLHLVDELKKPFKGAFSNPKTLEAVERDHIIRVLEQTNWKVSGKNAAAEILGLERSTLRARMRKLGIRKP